MRLSKFFFSIHLFVFLFSSAFGQPTFFYVSTKGNDKTGDGSISLPFATMNRAQTAVRLVNQQMKSDIFVYFREGSYFFSNTIQFTVDDGAFNGHTIHYASYPNEQAVLHGGIQVTNWTPISGTSLWSADLPDNVKDARQVYINGERMTPTNTAAGFPGSVSLTATGYVVRDPLPSFFGPNQCASDIELLFTGVGSTWTESRLRVQAVDHSSDGSTVITMQEPGFTLGRQKFPGQNLTYPSSVSNLFSFLGSNTPGQYYLNTAQHKIYYVPRPQDDMKTAVVIVPSTEVLIEMQGQRSPSYTRPVRGISFERISFQYAGWLQPNTGVGYVDMQSGFRRVPGTTIEPHTWVPVPGNLRFHTVESITILGCTFEHLGATAIQVDDSSQNVTVQNCTFSDISCGGVYVGQVDDVNVTSPERVNGFFSVDNNFFNGIPVEYHDCAVILGGYVVGTHITHNSILNNANTGISLGWGWSVEQAQNAGNNVITSNYVYGSNWLLEDGGSIYALGPQFNSTMARNYISTQRKLFGALYTDEGSAYWHITHNVVNNCPSWLHIWTASIHDEVVDFCWTNQAYMDVHGTRITISNITYITPGLPFPKEAQDIIDQSGVDWMFGPKP